MPLTMRLLAAERCDLVTLPADRPSAGMDSGAFVWFMPMAEVLRNGGKYLYVDTTTAGN